MSKGACLYPGSFDPVTNGHLDIIRRAAAVFDRVVVGVLVNADKRPSFTMEERVGMIRTVCRDLPNVEAVPFSGLTAELCRKLDIRVLVRGVRGAADLDAELRMARVNALLLPGLETVYFGAKGELEAVSSSLVRELAALGGDLTPFVPGEILEQVRAGFRKE